MPLIVSRLFLGSVFENLHRWSVGRVREVDGDGVGVRNILACPPRRVAQRMLPKVSIGIPSSFKSRNSQALREK